MRIMCVMLVNGRQFMVERALRCFHEQTYHDRVLLVLDSGEQQVMIPASPNVVVVHQCPLPNMSIGWLRNLANAWAAIIRPHAEIIAHWDSDDCSHPLRLAEQIDHLKVSGADVVGYHTMPFWDSTIMQIDPLKFGPEGVGETWLFTSQNPNYCLGTSMVYWRKTWEKQPFPNLHTAEDLMWQQRLKSSAVHAGFEQPRMIASIHGANTCAKIQPGKKEWQRYPVLDSVCREAMRL